jgi:hypothetical protein
MRDENMPTAFIPAPGIDQRDIANFSAQDTLCLIMSQERNGEI